MSTVETCRYLPFPENTLTGKWEKLYRRLAYDLWRRELKRFQRTQPNSRLRVVDVGCGPGFLLGAVGRWFSRAELTGVDQSPQLLAVTASRSDRIRALLGDASDIPMADGSADVVFALHVVEHLERPEAFFREARRVLRPGGLLLIATPNLDGLGARLMGERWSGWSDPTHIALHGERYWLRMIGNSGFEVIRNGTTGLAGIPLLRSLPLALLHWIPTFLFGFLPWRHGEACIAVAKRRAAEFDDAAVQDAG